MKEQNAALDKKEKRAESQALIQQNKTPKKAAEKPAEKPTKQPLNKTAKKMAEKPAEKKHQKPSDITKPNERFPPIIARCRSGVEITNKANGEKLQFVVKASNEKQTFYAYDSFDESFDKLKKIVNSSSGGGHTYSTKEEKRTTMLLKRLPSELGEKAVQEELTELMGQEILAKRLPQRSQVARDISSTLHRFRT